MKKVIFVCLIGCFSTATFAQGEQPVKRDSLAPPLAMQRQVFVYQMATKYGDQEMAKSALYNILAFNPNNIPILDSLALMYFQAQQYASAAFVSQDILSVIPDDMLATEIAALSFDNLGVKDRAIPYYEKLYLSNNSLSLLYQISFMQYELKRFNEASTNINIILNDPRIDQEKLVFSTSQTESQEVPLRAGIHRLLAMIAQANGNTEEARTQFNRALEVAPEFAIVRIQLKNLN